jgi:hypothetical protein
MKQREINKLHRWIEGHVSQDEAALGFVIACLSSITIVMGTAFAIVSWWLG